MTGRRGDKFWPDDEASEARSTQGKADRICFHQTHSARGETCYFIFSENHISPPTVFRF